jgi:hypothetical protein
VASFAALAISIVALVADNTALRCSKMRFGQRLGRRLKRRPEITTTAGFERELRDRTYLGKLASVVS